MRWHILKTLLYKEALRHATNRGGLMLAALLVTASLVLAVMNPAGDKSANLVGGIHHCYLHVEDDDSPWVDYLKNRVPPDFKSHILLRPLNKDEVKALNAAVEAGKSGDKKDDGWAPGKNYKPGTAAILIFRSQPNKDLGPTYHVWFWHPSGERSAMQPYEQWFWRETYRFFHAQAAEKLEKARVDVARRFPMPNIDADDLWDRRLIYEQLREQYVAANGQDVSSVLPPLELQDSKLDSGLNMPAAIATALVMFALFFTCVYLMPSLTCEERERGLLLAQALSPARAREILAAKFLFYPAFGILLATLLGGIHNPGMLLKPYFWLSLIFLAMGSLGIGMTIASLARTQRSSSLSALSYMLVVTLILLICQALKIDYVPYAAIEFHAPQLLYAALTNQAPSDLWQNLLGCGVLAVAWVVAAGILFRRRGWQ